MIDSHLLHDPATVHLQAEAEDVPLHATGQDLLLILVPVLKELLNHIVAKDVSHQLHRVLLDLAEDSIFLLALGGLQLLLDETGGELVTRKFNDVIIDVLEGMLAGSSQLARQSHTLSSHRRLLGLLMNSSRSALRNPAFGSWSRGPLGTSA